MEANELIKKINGIVDDAIEKSKKTMDETMSDASSRAAAQFFKASGIHQIASQIKLLLVKEGGLK